MLRSCASYLKSFFELSVRSDARRRGNVCQLCCDTLCREHVIERQLRHSGLQLDEERQRLADASTRTDNSDPDHE
jgi:hypothetical protein